MTTTHRPPATSARQVSLRALARELGVHHSSLSAAIHDRRLATGVRIDEDGRVTVTDADAAARCWKSIHVPQITEFRRMDERKAALQREVESQAEIEDRRDYLGRSVAAVLVALHLLDRGCDELLDPATQAIAGKVKAAIDELRSRFDYEIAAYAVDDDTDDALAYFDGAVENALEWFADQVSDAAEKELREKPKAKRTRKAAK